MFIHRVFNSYKSIILRNVKSIFRKSFVKQTLFSGAFFYFFMNSAYRMEEIPEIQQTQPKYQYIQEFTDFESITDLSGKHIIIYQSVDSSNDEVILTLLELFATKNGPQNFKILFKKASANPNPEMRMILAILKRHSSQFQFMDLEYYKKSSSNIEDFFYSVSKQIGKKLQEPKKINVNTIHQLNQSIKIDSQSIRIILKTSNTNSNYTKNMINFSQLISNLSINQKDVKFLVCDDQIGARILGLAQSKDGSINILHSSKSKNLKKLNSLEKQNIFGENFVLIKDIQLQDKQKLKQNYVFTPFNLKRDQSKYQLTLKLNKNSLSSKEIQFFYKTFADVDFPVVLEFSTDPSLYQLTLYKNIDDLKIQIFSDPEIALSPQEKVKILKQPCLWKFNSVDLSAGQINNWIKRVINNEQKPFYRSEKDKPYNRYSYKLTGETFSKILESDKDEVVFYYSSNCSSCKYFGKFYQQFARDNENKNLNFNRISNPKNKMKCGHNYNYSPVFAYFKKQNKSTPFVYKNEKFTKDLFRNFLELTSQIKLIAPEIFQKQIQSRVQAESNANL